MDRTEGHAEMVELDEAVEELATTSIRLLMLLRRGPWKGSSRKTAPG